MEDTQKQILGTLEKANNILVTVSRNPSVDQLSAAIGLTLALNKLGKHAIAVFSGQVPSTIEFLHPEDTLETNTDSLRDFIISLDKAKADKLRYKVEDDMVKIFITPYKTSLSQDDLQFSQGDFNVEVVMALGVHEQPELDEAIISHGRILHDATVIGVTVSGEARLGTINWVNSNASSLSEMLTGMVPQLKDGILDNQIATAFLTGIVAETERFSNDKTSSDTMQASSQLMAAGANQQLVATQLEQPAAATESKADGPASAEQSAPQPHREDGSLEIKHDSQPDSEAEKQDEQIHIDEHGQLGPHPGEQNPNPEPAPADSPVETAAPESEPPEAEEPSQQQSSRRPMALTPPTTGGRLTANTEAEGLSPSTDVLGDGVTRSSDDRPNLSRREYPKPQDSSPTLSDIEKEVSSPHLLQQEDTAPAESPAAEPQQELPTPEEPPISPPEPEAPSPELMEPSNTPPITTPTPSPANPLEDARNAVMAAMDGHAQPEPADLPDGRPTEQAGSPPAEEPGGNVEVSPDGTLNVHPSANPEPYGPPAVQDPNAPPEVPPPFMPPNYPPNGNQNQQ